MTMTIFYKGTAVRISSVQGDSGKETLSVVNAERPAIDLDMTNGLTAADLTADGGEREIAAAIRNVRRLTNDLMDDLRVEIADFIVRKATVQRDIFAFLAAFPDREIWTDEEARLAASEFDHDALLAKSIEDDGEGAAYHVEQDMTVPMLNDIEAYLKVDDLGAYLNENGDDYEFEALGRGFQVSLYYYDVTGQRQDFGMNGKTVRVVASLEPNPQWDEDNASDPLAMTYVYGRTYRFANATAPA